MADNYKEFDKASIADVSDVVIKGFRFRVRELILGGALLVCLLVIIILAALLASAKTSNDNSSASATSAGQAGGQVQGSCVTQVCLQAAAHVTALINASAAKPCDDFYTFACGNFPKLHPLEPDEGQITTALLIYHQNQDRLRALLEKESSVTGDDHYETKLRNFFASCKDHFTRMNRQGQPFLEKMVTPSGGWWALEGNEAWSSKSYDFQEQLRMVHVNFWTDAFFTFTITTDWLDWNKDAIEIDMSGIGMPFQYFFGALYQKEQVDYKAFMRRVAELLLRDSGLNITDAEKTYRVETFVSDAFYIEQQLAMIKRDTEFTVDPYNSANRLKLSDLNSMSQGAIDWVALFLYMFDDAPVTANTYVVVMEQDYVNSSMAFINSLPSSNKTRILNNYLIWRLAHSYVRDLSWDYLQAYHQVYTDLTGRTDFQSTWRYCLDKLDSDMPEALGALFVKGHFSEQNRRTAHVITDYVKAALEESLSSRLHWMSPQTRQIAIKKIQQSLFKLGFPDYMMSDTTINAIFQSLVVQKDDFFLNLISLNDYYKKSWNKRLSSVQDRTVWAYATYSFVVEYYNPWKELIVPAGVLQFPIYDRRSPRYMNFGSLGSVIARELTHAIDEIGNHYALDGSHFGSWWSNTTKQDYATVRKCMMDAYRNVTMGPFDLPGLSDPVTIRVNTLYYTPLALGEASGVKLAYKAYKNWTDTNGLEKSMPGSAYNNDQLFFISYAQAFCANRDPYSSVRLALRGTTVTDNIRVNGALAQVKEFQDVFQCPDTSKMVAPKRCSLY